MLSSAKSQFAVLVLVAVLVRGAALLMLAPSLEADPDGYRRLSESLAIHGVFGVVDAEGKVFPTAFRPPAYPWLLSWWVQDGHLAKSAVASFHAVLGIATTCLTFCIARRLFAPGRVSEGQESPSPATQQFADAADKRPLLAGLLVAVDPILLVQSAQVMTETFATFLAVTVWVLWLWLISRQSVAAERWAAGVLLAGGLTVAFFSRPVFFVWAFFLVVWLVALSAAPVAKRASLLGAGHRRDLLVAAGLIVVMIGGAIGWWTERNRRAIGHPVWATSHGGYTLLLGNNPVFYDDLRSGRFGKAWQAEPFHQAWAHRYEADPFAADYWDRFGGSPAEAPVVDDEVEDDRLAYEVAKATIRQQPAMFIWASLVRVGNLWSPLPHVTAERARWQVWGIGAFYLVITALVSAGAWSLRWRLLSSPWAPGLLLAIALTAVHAVYWSNLRMRAPAIPWFALLAVAGVERFVHAHGTGEKID